MKRPFAILGLVLCASLLMGAGQLYTGRDGENKPTCSESFRGKIWANDGAASAADQVDVCAKNAAGTYGWYAIPAVTATVTPIDLADISGNTCAATSITWTGVTDGEVITLGIDSAQGAVTQQAFATATNTIVLESCNPRSSFQWAGGSVNYRFERRLR